MPTNVFGFAGSLRRESWNHKVLLACQELMPESMLLEPYRLNGIPPYDEDLISENAVPEAVWEFKRKIEAADAILIISPEYNWGMTGVLKNALDWGSRPQGANSWAGKPVAITGASPGYLGTVKSQLMTRQVCWALDMKIVPKPEVLIPAVHTKFDAEGKLFDDRIREQLRTLLANLAAQVG